MQISLSSVVFLIGFPPHRPLDLLLWSDCENMGPRMQSTTCNVAEHNQYKALKNDFGNKDWQQHGKQNKCSCWLKKKLFFRIFNKSLLFASNVFFPKDFCTCMLLSWHLVAMLFWECLLPSLQALTYVSQGMSFFTVLSLLCFLPPSFLFSSASLGSLRDL